MDVPFIKEGKMWVMREEGGLKEWGQRDCGYNLKTASLSPPRLLRFRIQGFHQPQTGRWIPGWWNRRRQNSQTRRANWLCFSKQIS